MIYASAKKIILFGMTKYRVDKGEDLSSNVGRLMRGAVNLPKSLKVGNN